MHNSILSLPGGDKPKFIDSLTKEFEEAFVDLSATAESELSGSRFVFSRYGRELYPYFDESDATLVPECIIPIKEGRPVASVDSTCMLVGETSQGALYAARAAIGISYEGSLRRFFRLGPILVYASPRGLAGIRSHFSSPEFGMMLSDHRVAEGAIRNTLEKRVIDAILGSEEELVLMADGSLKHPLAQFQGSVVMAHREGKCLVGFSKSSNLIFSADAVSVLSRSARPCYCAIDEGQIKTVLAKFSQDGLVFRLDISSAGEPTATTLGRIMFNDAFASGYPDSLKVAHHLSIFSRAEDQAVKAYVTKRFRLRQQPTFSLRKIALGSFRGGA